MSQSWYACAAWISELVVPSRKNESAIASFASGRNAESGYVLIIVAKSRRPVSWWPLRTSFAASSNNTRSRPATAAPVKSAYLSSPPPNSPNNFPFFFFLSPDELLAVAVVLSPAVCCRLVSTRVFNSVTVASRRSRAVESNFSALSFLFRMSFTSLVTEPTSFSRLFKTATGSSALAFLSLSVLVSRALMAALSERRIKSSLEDMTSSLWTVESSVWPPDFWANPVCATPKIRAQKTARIRKRDLIKSTSKISPQKGTKDSK